MLTKPHACPLASLFSPDFDPNMAYICSLGVISFPVIGKASVIFETIRLVL